ncbi:hypothetical protein [Streptomyces pseudovenezuelae]|uniref:hypothetical protein n=1 Tax=Streptomyces pseudovenezuelae TaxID=67350 RepID=UPI002E37F017|nr:hypothetical protein [Streptomyces pseudovenezuelae]WUA90763.1 hypothetical protein OHO81_27285 [Streptomyces pseudovenezuelae]
MTQENTSRPSELGPLEPGTRQRAQLSIRIADIAWTALSVVAALWMILATVDAVRGTGSWAYSVVALALLTIGLTMRIVGIRRRARTHL